MKRYPALDIHFTENPRESAEICGLDNPRESARIRGPGNPRESAAPEADLDLRDRLVAGLDDFGPTAIEESATVWRVFFESAEARERSLAWLRDLGDPRVTSEIVDVDDEDWARRNQADLRPVRVGKIIVAPPWAAEDGRSQATADDLLIVIVPSTGFGTGHHASTRLCLALLQEIPVRDRSVLDVGTGSGVLAIAVARLGARSVLAVDNDPDAIDAVRENVALNPTDTAITIECADLRALSGEQADIVTANLTGDLLRRSAGQLMLRANAGGRLILSGVLAEEQAGVVSAFESAGARLVTVKGEDEWVGLHFQIPGERPDVRAPNEGDVRTSEGRRSENRNQVGPWELGAHKSPQMYCSTAIAATGMASARRVRWPSVTA